MPSPRNRPPLPFCGARTRAAGRCRRRVVEGTTRCVMHGSWTRTRVRKGTRRPPGRPVTTGRWVDPNRTRYTRLTELMNEVRDTPLIRDATEEVVLLKA